MASLPVKPKPSPSSSSPSFVRHQMPWPCLNIDASWSDLLAAYGAVRTNEKRHQIEKDIKDAWNQKYHNQLAALQLDASSSSSSAASAPLTPADQVMVFLSVRSALDVYLQVQSWPRGSEILLSAVNIPDMSVVLRDHGLIPVPCDIDVMTLAPRMDALEALRTPKTVGVLVAHLYGRRFDMSPYVEFARRHNLPLIEDCAECFTGFDYTGHPVSAHVATLLTKLIHLSYCNCYSNLISHCSHLVPSK
jgi:hypothetical protein